MGETVKIMYWYYRPWRQWIIDFLDAEGNCVEDSIYVQGPKSVLNQELNALKNERGLPIERR